jgi:hypothetical protein
MVLEPLKPKRGGFLKPFGCGWYICEFLMDKWPYDSPRMLRNNHKRPGKDSYPEYNDRDRVIRNER